METTAVLGVRPIAIFKPSQESLEDFSVWFDAEYPSLLRFAYFVTGDRSAAEDAVQEAFLRIYMSGARSHPAGYGAYARKTIVNLHRTSFRRKTREHEAFARAGEPEATSPDTGVHDEVWRAILELSPRQRAVVALRYYEDRSQKEVAEALGMSVGAVKKQMNRAMTRLREALGRSES